MSEFDYGSQIERGRRRLERLREQAGQEAGGSDSPLGEAVEELGETLEELSIAVEELAFANEELAATQLAAEEYARRFQDLFFSAPDGYIITDERGVIRELNTMAEQQLGRVGRYLPGKPLLTMVAQADRDRFLKCLAALRTTRGRLEDRVLHFGRDPGFDASVSAVAHQGSDGLEIRWMLRDVSELKERDAFRDEIERHLDSVVWLHQLEPLRTLHVSSAYEAVWGRPISAVRKNPRAWIEAVHPDDHARVEAAFENLLHGKAFDDEYRILRPDGEVRWIHDHGNAFNDAAGRLNRAAGIAEDITERKRTEAALERAERHRRDAALAAEHAEARERRALASDLHDAVGQSLALARAKLGALRDASDDSEQSVLIRELESLIADADERTRTLTFRLSPPVLHDLGLVAAADWLAEDLERRLDLKVEVIDEGLPELPEFEIREALFRSLRELLVNVARHSKSARARVRLGREADAATIRVEDEGAGFDPVQRDGIGFGLVSVRERLEGLGGGLEIDSAPGRGTRVRLFVPLAEG